MIWYNISICISMYIYIYIYIYRLRRDGVSTSGAAAKVMNFDGLGKMVHPGTSGKIKAG